MHKSFRAVVGLALVLVACSPDDQLTVQNQNSPDGQRALSRPSDVENLIAGSFASWYSGSMGGGNDNINNQMQVMALENGSNLANFAMGPRSAIPRAPALNARQNSVSAGNQRDFNSLSRAASSAALGLSRIGSGAGKLTLGSTAQDLRAISFGYFVLGLSHGYLSLVYDSAAFITPVTSGGPIPSIVGSDSLYRLAIGQLDSAIAYALNPAATGGNGFPTPATWIPSNSLSAANFVRLVRSYKAKIRASYPRDAAARAAVNWALVLADAQAGIQTDFMLTANPTTLFSPSWPGQHYIYSTWHQMPPLIVGMADTSGAYVAWITLTDMSGRGGASNPPPVIVTNDLRFPSGTTLAAQVTASGGAAAAAVPVAVAGVAGGRPYMRARSTGENSWDGSWNNSPYDFYRFRAWYNPPNNRAGPYPLFTKAEVNGLAAEAAYRTGNFVLASNYVDSTRVPAGLSAITPLALTAVGTVQGAGSTAACIPKVPTGAQGPVVCGGLFEAIKYEKRLETAYTSYGAWFFDMRGWGDLPKGTSVQWAVPWQELDTRFKTPYDRPAAELAPGSAYGW